MNGRPFRLNAFGSDIGGGLISWDSGRLASQDTVDCRIGFRFREASVLVKPALFDEINRGDRNVSSGHPAMQAVNPTVWEMTIGYSTRR